MDRIGPRLAILIAAAAALAGAALPAGELPIRAARWLDPPQRIEALTSQPLECAVVPGAAKERELFEIGRAAFRAPLLLGGQAARAGLSCASCHSNGRGNPAFRFPGLSGEAGTADVTSSLMSSHRGNGVFDPTQIPDLALPGKISKAPGDPALETFVRGLIVEEFDGAQPSPLILNGLGVYIRAIGRPGCDLGEREPLRLSGMLDDASRAVAAAGEAWKRSDPAAARLLLSSARSTLGLIDERFPGGSRSLTRVALRKADLDLLVISRAMDANARTTPARLAAWNAALPGWSAQLLRDEPHSLFAAGNLRKARSH